jgi:hypothetical protein
MLALPFLLVMLLLGIFPSFLLLSVRKSGLAKHIIAWLSLGPIALLAGYTIPWYGLGLIPATALCLTLPGVSASKNGKRAGLQSALVLIVMIGIGCAIMGLTHVGGRVVLENALNFAIMLLIGFLFALPGIAIGTRKHT